MSENLALRFDPDRLEADEGTAGPFLADMVRRWEQGERPGALDYLNAHPELDSESEVVLRLIYEEVCLRQEHDEELSQERLLARYPRWRKELKALLDCHRLLGNADFEEAAPGQPTIAGYSLVAQLGRGGQGAVYLARQEALDDRPVVLKISACRGSEHLTLARLQHTGIVPLHAAEKGPDENSRILCMPYFGGTTLQELLLAMREIAVASRRGSDLLAALDRVQATMPIKIQARGPARRFLASASYEQAIGWIGFCLAEALQFAHDRGYVHLDVKPANILLTADGQPMLLDFHVAQPPLLRGSAIPIGFGGTPVYMSPEQKAAFRASDLNQPATADVDGRTDLFSLGLVLFEALGGKLPQGSQKRRGKLVTGGLKIAPGLRDILARCLADDPADRYPHAAALAEDLRRQVQDLPLQGVRNRSLIERWRKWRRRRPSALILAIMFGAVLLAALSLLLVFLRHADDRIEQIEQALMDGRRQMQQRRYAEAATALQRGTRLAEEMGDEKILPALKEELQKARRASLAEKLHALADTFRFHGSDPHLRGDLKDMEAPWRGMWERRAWLTNAAADGWSLEEQQRLKADFLDLALIWADLQVRLAPADARQIAQGKTLTLLREAEADFGPSAVISLQRQELEEDLTATTNAKETRRQNPLPLPRTPWEHYALGRLLLEGGKLEQANELLGRAVELDPRGYWPRFYQGRCAFQRQDYVEAEAAFRVCVALAPEAAASHYHRGLALVKLGRELQAMTAFDHALRIDPRLGIAAYQRGLLHLEAKRYLEAITDFERALSCGHDRAPVHYRLALAHRGQGNRAATLAAGQNALRLAPNHKGVHELLKQIERE